MTKRFKPKNCLLPRLPKDEEPWIWLYSFLGHNLFQEFQKKFGNRRVIIPKYGCLAPCSYCPYRTHCIENLRRKGVKPAQIALRFGLSEKRIYSLLQS